MMRLLIWLLALAALAVGVSLAARYNEGYALFVLPPWRVELSLNLLVLLLLAGFAVLHLGLRLLAGVLALPARVAAFRARSAEAKAEAALRDAVRFLFEGRYSQGVKRAEAAFEAGHAPGLAAILAARCAQLMRDEERRALWLQRAALHDRETRGARLMAEATMAVDERDFETARAALEQLVRESGRHIAAQRLSLRVQQGLGDWHAVLRLLRQLEKHKAMTPDQAAVLRQRAHRENLRGLAGDAAALERYLNDMEARDRRDVRLAGDAAAALFRAGHPREAARLIEDALAEQWDSALVTLYGEDGGDVLGRISHAEQWLHQHPRDACLLLTLGRLCRRRELWGKARSYLEASLAIAPSRTAHLELAGLLDHLGQSEAANRHYRAAAAC